MTAVVLRNRRVNLMILAEGEVETVSLVHRGDAERILATVRDGVEDARGRIGAFLAAWGHARTVRVNPMATFKQWVEEKAVHVPGVRDGRVVLDQLLAAWAKEPGETLADCVNAVARAAHEAPAWGYDLQEQLERQAARLVYVGRR